MSDHAILAPSSAHRWLKCPASALLAQKYPSVSGDAAKRGTALHEVAAECLEIGLRDLACMSDAGGALPCYAYTSAFSQAQEALKLRGLCEEDHAVVQGYIKGLENLIASAYAACPFSGDPKTVRVWVEKKITAYHDDEYEVTGTADFCLVREYALKNGSFFFIDVVDLKTGRVRVPVHDNPQLMLYAMGVLDSVEAQEAGNLKDAIGTKITAHIIQPTYEDAAQSSTDIPLGYLVKLESDISTLVNALKTQKTPATFAAGDWCQYCPAQGACPAYNESMQAVVKHQFSNDGVFDTPVTELSVETVKKILDYKSRIKNWLDEVERTAILRHEFGEHIPGYSLKPKITRRVWSDREGFESTAQSILTEEDIKDLYTVPELKSIAQIEKTLKRLKIKGIPIDKFVTKPYNGHTIVSDSKEKYC